jgi:hypothetical protein
LKQWRKCGFVYLWKTGLQKIREASFRGAYLRAHGHAIFGSA